MMKLTGVHHFAGLWYASVVLLAVVSMTLTFQWGLLARPAERDRSTKYIRAAIYWLHTSMVMLVGVPIYMYVFLPQSSVISPSGLAAVEMHFSHAYYGAVRHAITVGFISLTILGMAAKVVPTLKGVDVRRLPALWLPFVLVNTGCALRVLFQVLTDLDLRAYPIAGVSGLFEVTGIAVWGAHLWRIMNRAEAADERHDATVEITGGQLAITGDTTVATVIARFPETLPVLIAKGFTPLENPWLRKTLARTITLRAAARMKGLDPETLVAELQNAASTPAKAPGAASPSPAGANPQA
jgi:hypothetical protein